MADGQTGRTGLDGSDGSGRVRTGPDGWTAGRTGEDGRTGGRADGCTDLYGRTDRQPEVSGRTGFCPSRSCAARSLDSLYASCNRPPTSPWICCSPRPSLAAHSEPLMPDGCLPTPPNIVGLYLWTSVTLGCTQVVQPCSDSPIVNSNSTPIVL